MLFNNTPPYQILSRLFILAVAAAMLSSCKKFLDIGTPPNALSEDKAFIDSATATSAVLALYTYPANSNPQSNCEVLNLARYGAMSADEAYYLTNSTYDVFRNNVLAAGNSTTIWFDAFANIGRANYAIRNLEASQTLSASVKDQLLGESRFWRAWQYFQLVNYYGDVPLVLNTDALTNGLLPRTPIAQVYDQIITDLTEARSLLSENYPSIQRARVNRAVASAFLAKVYLYRQNWKEAETAATAVLSNPAYRLETDLNKVFVQTSNEIILQLANTTGVTSWGAEYVPASATPNVVLYDTLVNTFETDDLRKQHWIKAIPFNNRTYHYPYKYKQRSGTAGNEYHVILRLAELYLIRAEARARQENVADGRSDLNEVRKRAGLPAFDVAGKEALLSALEHERWVELFTESGDRWFNLKRTGRAGAVLSVIKPQWKAYQQLYPLPITDLQANANLVDNPEY